MDVRVGLQRNLSTKELMLLNCGVGEDALRVPWTARRSNQSILKEISPEYSLEECWSWNSNTMATWYEELTHWKRPWCWKRLMVGREGGGSDVCMASPTQWTWIWVNSGSWWWTEVWRATIHGVAKSQTWLSNWTELITCINGKYWFV